MILSTSKHSTGSARVAIGYLLSPAAKDGTLRAAQPAILRGDPSDIDDLIKSVPYQHTYSSFWMRWAPEDTVTQAGKHAMIDAFQDTVFAGLEPAQRPPVLAVDHGDHLHLVMPRMVSMLDATGTPTGDIKSFNPHPPRTGSYRLLNAFCDLDQRGHLNRKLRF